MNRKVSILVIGVAILSIAATAVTASSFSSYTPLYTVRMEQASNEMNFSSKPMNDFTYFSENGYTVNYSINIGATNCDGICSTMEWTCPYSSCETCNDTCLNSCPNTCPSTCWSTCPDTCDWTCSGDTCSETCVGGTC